MTSRTRSFQLSSRGRRLRALGFAVAFGLSTALSLAAQDEAPAASTPVGKALERISAGDLPGAVAILEPLAASPQTSPLANALLGGLLVQVDRPADALKVLAPLAEAETADPAVLYNAGLAALAIGRASQGERYLERSVARDPSSIAGRELGLLRRSQGRTVDAFQLLRPWIERNPQDREAMLAAADCAVDLRRAPEAEQILERVSGQDDASTLIRAKLELLRGNAEGAAELLKPRLANAPASIEPNLLLVLADAYLRLGDSGAAVELLRGKTAGNLPLHLFLARATYQQGKIEEAERLFEPLSGQLLKGDGLPTGLAALGNLEYGRVLMAGGKPEKALPHLRRGTELMPDQRQTWQALGQALLMAGRREEGEAAMARFQEVSALQGEDPYRKAPPELANNDPTGRNLAAARLLLEAGKADEALAAIRQEQKLSPQDPRPWLQEVHALLILKQNQAAAAAAEKVVTRFPRQPDPLYLRGVTGLALDRLPEAEKDFRQAISLAPEHTAAMNDLAVLLMVQKRRAEAKKLLERVLELRPDDANARTNLARLEANSG